jgi:hypothetical protein
MFQMMGVFAEFERAINRERVLSGIARAKAEGVVLGRPSLRGPICFTHTLTSRPWFCGHALTLSQRSSPSEEPLPLTMSYIRHGDLTSDRVAIRPT